MIRAIRPSEMDIFATCQRKWGYLYIDKCRRPSSPAAQLGTDVHSVLEKYLRGQSIDFNSKLGQIAKPGLIFLPKDIPTEFIEHRIEFHHQDFTFTGTPDFFKHEGDGVWLLGDHKTCSAFATALKPETLKTNIQATTYAQWLFSTKKAQKVKLRWIYYRTKGSAQARCVEAEIKKEEQPQLFWPQLQISSSIMGALKSKASSLDMPKNLNACFKYGRCPFFGPCKANQRPATDTTKLWRLEKVKATPASLPSQSATKKNSFHLFIDCVPIKAQERYDQTLELAELLSPVLEKIHLEKEVEHYRLAGYGTHVGLIANYLHDYLKNRSFDDRTAILSSVKTPEGCDTLETLSAAAGQIVRGF